MKVFISWSGARSKRVALAMRDFLPRVLAVDPWLSATDISLGARWGQEIAEQLQACQFGIVCVTRENLHAPWIFFEAGALSKAVTTSYVCPYLVGVEPGELVGPLTLFQACGSDKTSTLQLLHSINRHARKKAGEKDLLSAFEASWPEFAAACGAPAPPTGRSRPALGPGAWQKLQPLEFAFVWGDFTHPCCAPAQVRLNRTDERWAPPNEIAGLLWQVAYDSAEQAARHHRDFRWKPLERVRSHRIDENNSLELTTELTMYLQFAATNLALEKNAAFREAVARRVAAPAAEARQPFLSAALNVIGCVVSRDGALFTPRRGPEVYEKPNRYQASTGGFVERTDATAAEAFIREIGEELGIERGELDAVATLGFGYNEITGEPDLLMLADSRLSMSETIDRFRRGKEERIDRGKGAGELADVFVSARDAAGSGARWKSVWWLTADELPELFGFLRSHQDWSQPSDRAAVLAAVCRKLGADNVFQALDNWHPHAR